MYQAIKDLVERGVLTIDPYNIIECLNASEGTRKLAESITVDKLQELMEMSDTLSRESVGEYKLMVGNVLDAAYRRDTYDALKRCMKICVDPQGGDARQEITDEIDRISLEYSTVEDTPEFKDVVDDYWSEIKARQQNGYAGIPFKFKTLNEYATLESGELFIFAAEAKQGKSMILLNCAIDLLKKDKSVLYLDSELNTRLFTARVISYLTGIKYKRLTSGNYTPEEEEEINKQIAWMKTRKFTHVYIPMFDQQTIYTTVKRVKHVQGIDVLIVDYFKSSGDGDAFNSYQELGRFVDLVKNKICGEMGICGLGAAQATAMGKIADSAKIGRNASTIAIIQDKTPEEIELDGECCGNKKLRVVLNRNGMQHASGEYIDMMFDGDHISYEEAPQQHVPQTPY